MSDKKINFDEIKMLIMDVDGVLTDGGIYINDDGSESKRFNVLDGHGIKLFNRAGLKTAIISGRNTKATAIRAEQLGINFVYQGCLEKLPVFEELLEKTGLLPHQTAYIGDDVVDIPLLKRVGFAVAVSNCADKIKEFADWTTSKTGGNGAVRETVEYILKKTGKWNDLMKRYL